VFRTLYSKLAAVLLGLFTLVGGVTTYGTLRFIDLYYAEAEQRLNQSLAAHLAEQSLINEIAQANPLRLRSLFDMQMIVNPSIQIYLLDPNGKLLSYSAAEADIKRDRVSTAPIEQFMREAKEFPIYGDDPRESTGQRIFSATPIPVTGTPQGYLYVILGGETRRAITSLFRDSHVIKLAVGIGTLILVVAFAAGLILFGTITRRLEQLAYAMDEFKRSDFSVRPFVAAGAGKDEGDEITRLTANFRDLALRTAAQLHNLKQTDVLRRELVANVSHDLKTPIATLQGYVDTLLLKDDRLSREERQSYLQIASRSCERLSKLVANLIELAKLDAKEVTLQVEAFSPAELLQDIAQKFQLKAEQRKISLETDLPERVPYVAADIGLIERVLENLIGNALAHTDAGGVVRLGLVPEKNRVTIKVADTGVGIAEEEIPHVFERFYQVSNSTRGSENAGLGLAITKGILDLHGASMKVDSKVGVGTVFAFSLPKAILERA
jgi:two-component system, OmpR family, sensor kinase